MIALKINLRITLKKKKNIVEHANRVNNSNKLRTAYNTQFLQYNRVYVT